MTGNRERIQEALAAYWKSDRYSNYDGIDDADLADYVASAIQAEVDAAVRAENDRCAKRLCKWCLEGKPYAAPGWQTGMHTDVGPIDPRCLASAIRLSKLEKESK